MGGGGSLPASLYFYYYLFITDISIINILPQKITVTKGAALEPVSGKGLTSRSASPLLAATPLLQPRGRGLLTDTLPALSLVAAASLGGNRTTFGLGSRRVHPEPLPRTQVLCSSRQRGFCSLRASRLHLNYFFSLNCEQQVQPLSLVPKWQIKTCLDGVYG